MNDDFMCVLLSANREKRQNCPGAVNNSWSCQVPVYLGLVSSELERDPDSIYSPLTQPQHRDTLSTTFLIKDPGVDSVCQVTSAAPSP